jgi:[protein-PII] uridylyltransferase
MTPWRAAQLWQLYMAVYNRLTQELASERIESAASPQRTAFLEGLPSRYLRTRGESEIASDIELVERATARGVAVELRRLDSAWEMTLAAPDRPGLFASAAGALAAFGMNILRAEAFTNARGMVLDTFSFADPLRALELNGSEIDRLRLTVERVISGRSDVRELLRNRPKPVPPSRKARIPARVACDGESGGSATLFEIVAEDRPGLLYDLASTISSQGANIEVVLIDTQAHKAIDVFYVTAGGSRLSDQNARRLAEALRMACQGG